jgi:resuscitation-promoting factor RpfA
VVDGVIGPRTARAIQGWVGVRQTGVFDRRTIAALQRRVGVRADGSMGLYTTRAIQVKIGAPLTRNGLRSLNVATVSALQQYLNRR